ncbi:S8 family serine peptidase [Micromonospora sp. URMC 106]|uniref:S8 family serine peptidase n=1 Tax=Micromonospora sp. URMC 106 TaxID=3423408 RepID=UPI003F1CB241
MIDDTEEVMDSERSGGRLMRFRTRLSGGLAVVALGLPLGLAAQPAAATSSPVARTSPTGDVRVVTLVTGDKVTVAGGRVTVEPGRGRGKMRFVTQSAGGRQRVIPVDALPLVSSGRLDPRLFEVTTLVEYGYDDRRKDLPLIVGYGGASATSARGAVKAADARVARELPGARGFAVRSARDGDLWAKITKARAGKRALVPGVSKVWLDGVRKPLLAESVPQVGAPVAWKAGYDGSGVTVAVLDTGVEVAHPDLADRVAASANFTDGFEDDRDQVGHGTHVASTIAGTGAASGGRYRGVAPGARLLNGKICVRFGCSESWILAGMQWAAEQGADVVNMSIGGSDTPGLDPVEEAVERLTAQYGTLFVAAAGNDGADASVNSPASADAALAVGAVNKADGLAEFSSRGPRAGDAAVKPDITAPGVDITAARSGGGASQPYVAMSGTSMATPHVAGAAAILAQRHPAWPPARLKAALMGSARPNPALSVFAQGAGRLDIGRALDTTVTVDPPSVNFGRQAWPHHDATPVTETISLHNHGSAAVTLSLKVKAVAPDGNPAPAGMFSTSATSVTVAAGGSANVTVTADVRANSLDGRYGGQLVAEQGDTVITVPIGLEREPESYDLTLVHTNRDGRAADSYSTTIWRTDTSDEASVYDADGSVTLRLPKASYVITSTVDDVSGDDPAATTTTLLAHPRLELSGDRTVMVDARRGGPVSLTVPRADAVGQFMAVAAEFRTGVGIVGSGVFGAQVGGVFAGQLGPDQVVDGFETSIQAMWATPGPGGSSFNSPHVYRGAWYVPGRMTNGLERRVTERDLATVRSSYARQSAVTRGNKTVFPVSATRPGAGGFGFNIPFDLPFTNTEYYTGEGVRWIGDHHEQAHDAEGLPVPAGRSASLPLHYEPGRTYVEEWNRGVFGPAFGQPRYNLPEEFVTRRGDTITVALALYSDGDGRSGWDDTADTRIALFRDGVKIGEVDASRGKAVFQVPEADAAYRLEVRSQRGADNLSTRIDAAWTFRSGRVAGDAPVRLPLLSATFNPRLDEHNRAPSGAVAVPVVVGAQPGSGAGNVERVTVAVSFDDGLTWRTAPVLSAGGRHTAMIVNPTGAGFASLRVKLSDGKGNAAEHTIIRGYRFGSGEAAARRP